MNFPSLFLNTITLIALAAGIIVFYLKTNEIQLSAGRVENNHNVVSQNDNFHQSYFKKNLHKYEKLYRLLIITVVALSFIHGIWNIWNVPFQNDEIFHAETIHNSFWLPSLDSPTKLKNIYLRGAIVFYLARLDPLTQFMPQLFLRLPSIILFLVIPLTFLVYLRSEFAIWGIWTFILLILEPWLFNFSRYTRFYMYTLTLSVFLSIYLFNKPFIKQGYSKNQNFFWIVFGFLTPYLFNEYLFLFYLLLGFIFFLSYISSNLKQIMGLKIVYICLGAFVYIASNFLLTYMISSSLSTASSFPQISRHVDNWLFIQLTFLLNNYALIIIPAVCLSVALILNVRNTRRTLPFYFALIFLGNLVIEIFINFLSYNESLRLNLFIVLWAIPIAVFSFLLLKMHGRLLLIFTTAFFFFQIVHAPLSVGDTFRYDKYVFEKQPVVLDNSSLEYIISASKQYSLVSVCGNPLFTKFYFDRTPNLFVRGSSNGFIVKNGIFYERTNDIPVATSVNALEDFITRSQKNIIFDICGTSYPVYNSLYDHYLNAESVVEVPKSLILDIENRKDNKVFLKRDGISRDIIICKVADQLLCI